MKTKIPRNVISGAIAVALFCAAAFLVHAATITVTNTSDSGSGSLRQALIDASDGDTITFAASGTVGLTSGELLVDKNVTIQGPGASSLAVDGNGASRVFHISSGKTVTISGLTITNGYVEGDFPGGGIYNDHAMLTLSNCTISGNYAMGTVYCCDRWCDCAYSSGGYGAGIYNDGTLTLSNCTISGNVAGTYTGDGDGSGGGIYNGSANLTISNCTLSGNEALVAGGNIYLYGGVATVFQIGNTILKAGASGENIFNQGGGTIISQGYNLSSDNGGGFLTGPGDQINVDPMLGPLQDNGGPTFTHKLLTGSPAINAGNPNFTPPPFYDQRGPGFDRVRDGRVDIGAFEVQSRPPVASFTFSCNLLTCSFDASNSFDPDGTITSYAWNLGDDTTASGRTISHTYASGGYRTVTLTVTDNTGATAVQSQTVFANSPPVASFTFSSNRLTCSFDGSASHDSDDGIVMWSWNFGDGTSGSNPTTTHSYFKPGTYVVTLTVKDAHGATASQSSTVTVSPRKR
jgi:PKD repeat protein